VTGSEQTRITWRKSTASTANSACVEVAFADELVLVRNSRDPLAPALSFSRQEWAAFLEGVSNGEFTPD
jgi:predicted secreted Zn-dependent protease